MKKIIISAAYFGINMGDEAILNSIIESIYSIKKDIKIIVLAWDRKNVLKAHEDIFKKYNISISHEIGGIYQLKEPLNYFSMLYSFFNILTCDYFVFGGGGLINEEGYYLKRYLLTLKIANFFRKKTFVFAIGVNKLNNKLNSRQVVKIFNKVNLISVRDEKSKENLILAGIKKKIEVVLDPVFLLNTPIKKECEEEFPIKIGLNLRTWFNRCTHFAEEKDKIEYAIKNISKALLELTKKYNCEFYFFPFDKKKDIIMYNKLIAECGLKIINQKYFSNPDDFLRKIGEMDLFIGMRLHSLIFSIICNIPFLAVSYTEKTNNLIKFFGWSDYNIKIDDLGNSDFNYRILEEKLIKLINSKEIINIDLVKKRRKIMLKSEKNIELLKKFLYE